LFFDTPILNIPTLSTSNFFINLQNQITKTVFSTALFLVTLLGWIFWIIYIKNKKLKILLYILQATIFLNFFSHLGNVIFTNHYQMGFLTAMLINLPFSIYLFYLAFKHKWLSKKNIFPIFVCAILFHGPLLFGIMVISLFLDQVFF
jgi:hypothetical protein